MSVSLPMIPSSKDATSSSEGVAAPGAAATVLVVTGGGTYSFTLSIENIFVLLSTSSHACFLLQLTTRYGPSHLPTGFSRNTRTSMPGRMSATAARGTWWL